MVKLVLRTALILFFHCGPSCLNYYLKSTSKKPEILTCTTVVISTCRHDFKAISLARHNIQEDIPVFFGILTLIYIWPSLHYDA